MNLVLSLIGIFILFQLAIILYKLAADRQKKTSLASRKAVPYAFFATICAIGGIILLILVIFL